jgi:large conductance mechanosensitive channel
MSVVKEFKEFAMKGSVVDLAVGIIIGGAFGKIVSSLVGDVIMPPLGMVIGGVDFRDLAVTLKAPLIGSTAVLLRYGAFLQTIFDFAIIAFAVFLLIKGINALKRRKDSAPAVPPMPTAEELLLTEIRDLLRKQAGGV